MWAVEPPTVSAGDAARLCSEGIRNRALRERVAQAVPEFERNSGVLQGHIHAQDLHGACAQRDEYPIVDLSPAELRDLYETQIARRGSRARSIYDHVMSNAFFGLCSYCMSQVANTLDHFVPKSQVEALAIDPWNLVPACGRCNQMISARIVQYAEQQFIHPYCAPQAVSAESRWLFADLQQGVPLTIKYRVDPDTALSEVLRTRIRNQFEKLELAEHYSKLAANELGAVCRRLTKNFPAPCSSAVYEYLTEQAALGFAENSNSRKGVLYESLSVDPWFIAGGYAQPEFPAEEFD